MAKERRDNKNRILSKGEYQKEDGRYMYRYTEIDGTTRYLYSWRLTASDRTPKGRQNGPCLRDLEKEVEANKHNGLNSHNSKKATSNDYFEIYMSQKKRLKPNSRNTYRYLYDHYVRDKLGHRKIAEIKYSDIKQFYVDLVDDDGSRLATVRSINMFLSPIFNVAEKDECIRRNPARGTANEVKKELGVDNMDKKIALTANQQENFISYVKEHSKFRRWYPLFGFLLGTGCRIGEACALTWDDVDFENEIISINKTISYTPDEITREYRHIITAPKTSTSKRKIPMFTGVKKILLNEKQRQHKEGFCQSKIGNTYGFVFNSRDNTLVIPQGVNHALTRIIESYNETEIANAKKEKRKPELLPKFSPHTLRHTFCTRLCESGVNPKVVQELMGHKEISITMNVYNNLNSDFLMEEVRKNDSAIKIG